MYVCVYACAQLLSHVQLFATPWTIALQAPLSMGFSKQEYCPWDSPGIEFQGQGEDALNWGKESFAPKPPLFPWEPSCTNIQVLRQKCLAVLDARAPHSPSKILEQVGWGVPRWQSRKTPSSPSLMGIPKLKLFTEHLWKVQLPTKKDLLQLKI